VLEKREPYGGARKRVYHRDDGAGTWEDQRKEMKRGLSRVIRQIGREKKGAIICRTIPQRKNSQIGGVDMEIFEQLKCVFKTERLHLG